jgi:hypothetical protein
MVPLSPTAKQVVAVGQLTLKRELVVPEDWGVQIPPPSVVARIVPLSPTARQVMTVGQLMS